MKTFTNRAQSAKLIELGFEKPKTCLGVGTKEEAGDLELGYIWAYSIGELIELLGGVSELEITRFGSGWGVYDELRAFTCEELIDALYDMLVKLKEEGVI